MKEGFQIEKVFKKLSTDFWIIRGQKIFEFLKNEIFCILGKVNHSLNVVFALLVFLKTLTLSFILDLIFLK